MKTFWLGAILSSGAPLLIPVPSVYAQEVQSVSSSQLAGINLPSGAQRVAKDAVPSEVNDALAQMINAGGQDITRGQTEVFTWTGVSSKRLAEFKKQIAANLKTAGWTYDEGETLDGAKGTTMVSAIKTAPVRRGLIGFWVPNRNTFLLAWTEMLPAQKAAPLIETPEANAAPPAPISKTSAVPVLPSRPVNASVAAGSSVLTGIQLPRHPEVWNAISTPFTNVLTALSKEKPVNVPPTGAGAEVWAWRGDAFRADRVSFTKTAVASALSSAGYNVSEIDQNELREVNIFEHFSSEDENLPFHPTLTARPSYFKAINAAKGQAVLGAWIQSDNALALGILPVQYKAAPVAKPLPGVGANVVLVQNFKNVSQSVPALKLPSFAPLQKKPRTVRGWAKDLSGKPLAGVEVAVQCSAGGGFRTTHKARTNAQGLYEVLLPVGVAEVVQAEAQVSWNGESYLRYLAPASGHFTQFNAQNGHVENLVLQSAGAYGGNIRVLHGISEGGTIEITLKSQGAQMDGAPGRTFVFRYPSGLRTSETFFQFIPVGRYTLSARLLEDGEALPLRVRHTFGDDQQLQTSLPVKWESGYDALSGDTGNSHLRAFQVTLEP